MRGGEAQQESCQWAVGKLGKPLRRGMRGVGGVASMVVSWRARGLLVSRRWAPCCCMCMCAVCDGVVVCVRWAPCLCVVCTCEARAHLPRRLPAERRNARPCPPPASVGDGARCDTSTCPTYSDARLPAPRPLARLPTRMMCTLPSPCATDGSGGKGAGRKRGDVGRCLWGDVGRCGEM